MMGEVIRVSGRAPDVRDILKEAMLSQRFADVALCCPGGQRFLAHRLVLSAASPYLQEVLLAHSKVTAQCEPITVILAETEAPELASLLGFIYTGNVTIPRVRLNAFLHAAETLRIKLPPVPAMTICDEQAADCKPEDLKEDVKIKYLHCDRYSWERPSEGPPYEDSLYRKNSCVRIFATDHNSDILRDARMFREVDNPGPSYGPRCPSAWPVSNFSHQDGVAIGDPSASMMLADENLAMNSSNESSLRTYRRDVCFSGEPPAEEYARLESLERIGTEYGRLRVNCSTEKPMDENTGGSRGEGLCGRTRDECAYLGEIPSSSSQCPAATSQTRLSERFDYATQTGEDLSCSESCCRWRTSRKHVANRVTASPWRQIIRPHHSPRMPRPAVAQQRHVDDETQRKPLTPEPARSTVISMSPKVHSPRSTPRSDGHYAFEAPTTCEMTLNSDSRSRAEIISGPEMKNQEIYRSPVSLASCNQIAPFANAAKNHEPSFQATTTTLTRLLPAASNDSVITNTSRNNEHSTHVAPQTPMKPELSHPISRLCDTIESDEKKEISKKTETASAEKNGEERIARIFVNSDDNNNNETIGTEVVVRGRSADDHRCDQCGKTFVTRASLKTHSRTHSGEKPFRCADCGKQFSQLRNYKYHRSVHEGTREFAATCPECGKYFNDRGYLSSHMKIHRNRKEYGCAECGKSFNQRVAYNMHVRIHTGVKPHQCEQCGKAFSRKMLLKQHLRTHSGERPYQCQVCQKAFADRSNMTLHTRLHSGLKPYQCNLCSKAFTKKHHLKTHLNYHTGTKPYTCTNCGSRFSQSSNMRTHFKKCIVNNASGATKRRQSGDREASVESSIAPQVALTPPNSDQESSILTPISKSAAVTDGSA